MNIKDIIKILLNNRYIIVGTSILLVSISIILTSGEKKQYKSHTLLNTGLISGYNIESQGSSRVDYAYTNNEIENLINLASTTETLKNLAFDLLSRTIIDYNNGELRILESNREEFVEIISSLDLDKTQSLNLEKLKAYLSERYNADKNDPVFALIHSKLPYFSLEKLQEISVTREGNSDMIRMEYQGQDPYMCKLTLERLTGIFLEQHKQIKEGQTDSVIDFFQTATDKSLDRLNFAEKKLLKFSVDNRIINYYEQTRFISGNKEELDKKYQEELKVLAASDSAIENLEAHIDDLISIPELNQSLIHARRSLSDIKTQMAFTELNEAEFHKMSDLNANEDSVRNELIKTASMIIQKNSSPEGLNRKVVLERWLMEKINKAQAEAKIEVLDKAKLNFENIYDQFAPLGSTLKKLEREIDVAEREYLENLHSFNQAKLHKYNMLMSSNLKVIDPPFFPAKPESSKRVIMIMLAGISGLVMSIGVLLGIELLDSSIKTPSRAETLTGLEVIASLPYRSNSKKEKNVNYEKIERIALNLFFQKLNSLNPNRKKPLKVALISHNPEEGKSYFLQKISEYTEQNAIETEIGEAFNNDKESEYDFVELASFLEHRVSLDTLRGADINILVCNANRRWTESDMQALKILENSNESKTLLMLNGVSLDNMEAVIGEIPKERSKMRMMLKRLILANAKTSIA